MASGSADVTVGLWTLQSYILADITMNQLFRFGLLGALGCLLLALAGSAQTSSSADPYKLVIVTTPNPYWGYTRNPYASALHGRADLVRATADYHVRIQKAAQEREKTRKMKLDKRIDDLKRTKWADNFIR